MERKINIAELLKDCPKGMELDCTMFEGIEFDGIVDAYFPIRCRVKHPDGGYNVYNFTEYGCWTSDDFAKCVIFPKGKMTWEGFQRSFNDGDILVGRANKPFIFQSLNCSNVCYSYCGIDVFGQFRLHSDDWTSATSLRFATEEEKQELFDAIKANGYKWNEETKTLEKLAEQKFDINTLVPFESRVLIRDRNNEEWRGEFFSHYNNCSDRPYICIGIEGLCEFKQCIPYEGNQHLLGTTDDCDEFYKTWG